VAEARIALVPTPIGNLGDITLRAVETLRAADAIYAEDTRRTAILLQHLELRKPLVSLHAHNEAQRTAEILVRHESGDRIALVTDAGMPGVSDPGMRLVRACRDAGIAIDILPGPSAVMNAWIGSGFAADAFYFGGFLPVKDGQRTRELTRALARSEVSVFFESPHRIVKSLRKLAEIDPERRVCVARELTKKFEEYRQNLPSALVAHYTAHPPKGEICLVVCGTGRRSVSFELPEDEVPEDSEVESA